MTTLHLEYYAQLREQAGTGRETVDTDATSLQQLFGELAERHGFSLAADQLKVAVNTQFCDWDRPLADGDTIVFIPPVAGG